MTKPEPRLMHLFTSPVHVISLHSKMVEWLCFDRRWTKSIEDYHLQWTVRLLNTAWWWLDDESYLNVQNWKAAQLSPCCYKRTNAIIDASSRLFTVNWLVLFTQLCFTNSIFYKYDTADALLTQTHKAKQSSRQYGNVEKIIAPPCNQ